MEIDDPESFDPTFPDEPTVILPGSSCVLYTQQPFKMTQKLQPVQNIAGRLLVGAALLFPGEEQYEIATLATNNVPGAVQTSGEYIE